MSRENHTRGDSSDSSESTEVDSLATATTVVMGEGNEQTPLATITEIPFVEFQDRNPTDQELELLKISKDADLYTPLLKSVDWKKGKRI